MKLLFCGVDVSPTPNMARFDLKKFQLTFKVLTLAVGQQIKMEETRDESMKMEISKCIHENKVDSARLKAGEVVRIRNRVQALEALKIYIEQVGFDIPLLQRTFPQVPEHLTPVVHSIIFASGYYGIKQLADTAKLFQDAYGKKFIQAASVPGTTLAPQEFVQKVIFLQPDKEQVELIIDEVREFDERRNMLVENYKQFQKAPPAPGPGDLPSPPADGAAGANDNDDLEALRKRLNSM